MCMVRHVYSPACEDQNFSVIGWNSVALFWESFVKLRRFPIREFGLIYLDFLSILVFLVTYLFVYWPVYLLIHYDPFISSINVPCIYNSHYYKIQNPFIWFWIEYCECGVLHVAHTHLISQWNKTRTPPRCVLSDSYTQCSNSFEDIYFFCDFLRGKRCFKVFFG